MASPQASSRLEMLQARFQQKQLQEKEQKLLQLYDQQQQRAHQVAQRGSAGSNNSNPSSTMNHQTVTRTTTTTRTTSTSQGGKVRQMFDERRQTTVKGIDRSYPLEPLDTKPKKQTTNGFTPSKSKNISKHTVTTVKRSARADVNSNLNDGKPVVSYHEEFNRECFGDKIQNDDEFANENEIGRYLNGNCRNRTELQSDDEETLERNRMMGKIHLMEFDKSYRPRVFNDLENEKFPEELMLDIPDKVPRKPVAKRLSQSELRLERFKNANVNSKKNVVSRTLNSSVTRKRSDPLFPTQTATRDSPPTKTRKQDQEISKTRSAPKKERDPSSCPTTDKEVLDSETNLQESKFKETSVESFEHFHPNQERLCQVSRESEISSNQNQNRSELRSTFLIREVIQGRSLERDEDLEFEDADDQGLRIEDLDDDVFKIEEIEDEPCKVEEIEIVPIKIEEKEDLAFKKEEKGKRFVSGRDSPQKLISKTGASRKYSIERTPSPVFKKSRTESIQHDQEDFQSRISSKISTFSQEVKKSDNVVVEDKKEVEKVASVAEKSIPQTPKRRGSETERGTEKRRESVKTERTDKRRGSIKIEKTEKRKESIKIKEAEKIEDEIFIDDHCFRKRGRRKIKDSIREKLNIDLRAAIQNKFTLPVKKPQKKKSQDESRNFTTEEKVDVKEVEEKYVQITKDDSDKFSRGSSPEKMFERPSDYQEIVIEDQTIDSRRKNIPSPQITINSRRQSVENSETISSAAKRKPSLENRRLSATERNFNREKKIETENTTENKNKINTEYKSGTEIKIKIENKRKSLDLEKPLKSIELVKQANKTSRSQSLEEEIDFPMEKIEHKIVKKQEAIFDMSDKFKDKKPFEKNTLTPEDVDAKMIEVEIKRREVENKMNEVEAKKREVETKMKEVEERRKEFESRKKEVETKKKEVETKMKEIETQIKGIGIHEEKILKKEIQPKKSSLQFEDKVNKIKSESEIFDKSKKKVSIPKFKDEVDNVEKPSYKVVKEIEIRECRRKLRGNSISETQFKEFPSKDIQSKKIIDSINSEEKLKSKPSTRISRTSPMPKVRKTSSKLDSVISAQKMEIMKLDNDSPIKIEITQNENIKGFKRTDSVESALRRFDSIGTDTGFNTSKESIRNKSPDSTKSRNENNFKIQEKKSSKNLQIRKKSSIGSGSKKLTPQRPIAAPRNQRKSRRLSENGKNVDYSRISAARDSIELARNFIRTKSPSCKRRLFQNSDLELKNSSSKISNVKNFDEEAQETVATIFQEKLKVTGKRVDQKEKGFLVEKQSRQEFVRQFSKNNKKGGKRNYGVSVRREIRKEIQNQSSSQTKERRVFISGTFIKKGKSRENENVLVFRNARSSSPDFGERKQNGNSRPSTRRSVPPSPSKSPDSDVRRGSAELKTADLKVTRRPLVHSPRKEEFVQEEEISDFSKDVVDASNFENPHKPLESNEFETGSATVQKKCDAFVVDLDDSAEIKKSAKKPMIKSEKTVTPQKSNSPTNLVPRPSSSLSVSSGGSAKGKMATKMRSAASRGQIPKSPGSLSNRADCNDSLVACNICGRRFASDRVGLHEQICSKAGQKKRKQFDAMKFRIQGTELEPYVRSGVKKQESKTKKQSVKSNWRKTHEDFINTIRSAKQVQAHLAAGGKLSDLPPPPPSDNSDYVQCPHCGRKFNESAAERHIPKCETMRHNKPNPRAPPKPRR